MTNPGMTRRGWFLLGASALIVGGVTAARPAAAENVLKIGVLGVMSGPAASWGLVNKYCAEATAQMYNEKGGVEIGGEKYRIQIVAVDDKNDPKLSVSGAERLIQQEKIRYIIGPNVDTTAASVRPVAEKNGAIYIPYAFSRSLYTPPAGNAILGMIASYQAGPIIYKYLQENKGVKKVAFVARNESDPLNQRDEGVAAAKKLGLEVVSSADTYEPGTSDFFPVMSKVVSGNPDLIVLSGVAPADAPLLIKTARELGFQGTLSTETAQDAKIIGEVAGDAANGFISVGGASTPEIRSPYMEEFVKRYEKVAGEWNDEAGTKVYALEMILATLQKTGKAGIDDVGPFKQAIDTFSIKNPFLKENAELKYVGTAYFGQKRQIGVPMVVNEYRDGGFKTLFVGSVE
ncbi:ABC transporter substrate-binding protein [Benzoatithermus flavus]|uniref:ABC transporter substrate-binding protein n=1 Tax=Benzoatithermus flavus TaxID=3108223 RepID=A0ABU8XRN3_9PROT